ncbi:MAG: hypothetical protein QXV97_05705 [Candidatus Caldarchaeum sp.]
MGIKPLMMLAVTVGVLLAGWGVLLSPPLTSVANALGIRKPDDIRMNVLDDTVVAEICNTNEVLCKSYLARLTMLYHSVFAVLVAMTLYQATAIVPLKQGYAGPTSVLGTAGYLMVVAGGIGYGYWVEEPFLHGVFIAGLSLLFASGLLFVTGMRLRDGKGRIDYLSLNIFASALLLLATSLIGAWIGANEMVGIGKELRAAKILAKIDPDLGEEVFVWRAMTAHQHAMVATLGAAIVFTTFKYLNIDVERKSSKILLAGGLAGQLVMVAACWAVWPYGKTAHLLITPAAVGLIFFTALIAIFEAKKIAEKLKAGTRLADMLTHLSLYSLAVWVWPSVAIPGAVVAMSLRKPVILRPEFRNPVWNWAENAYNIGHWHVLLMLYASALFIVYMDVLGRGRLASYLATLTSAVAIIVSTAINFYMIPRSPAQYVPNPYNDPVLTYVIEPFLVLLSFCVAAGFIYMLTSQLRVYRTAAATLQTRVKF